jgi:hypothetical protein
MAASEEKLSITVNGFGCVIQQLESLGQADYQRWMIVNTKR